LRTVASAAILPCAPRKKEFDMDVLPISLTIAGAAALLNLWLGVRVTQLRARHGVSIGDGGNQAVATRMRAHANFIEYAPLFLILLALVELARGSETWLWALAILFVLGRLAHAFGMDRKAPNALRMGGMLATWIPLVILAGYALAIPYIERGTPTDSVTFASG
jgi:uncharacterized membrane protein YecN with MAPEG domain